MSRFILFVIMLSATAAVANSPPSGSVAVSSGYPFAPIEIWGAGAIIFFSVFVTAASYFLRKNAGFSEEGVIRLVSLVLIVSGTLFLVTLGYSAEQIAPALGILGTIAGYMLGRSDRNEKSEKPDVSDK